MVLDTCGVDSGRCYAWCPMIPVDYSRLFAFTFGEGRTITDIGPYHAVMACRAIDKTLACRGQGGGTVTATVMYALEQGLIDCAILTGISADEKFPTGVVAERPAEVGNCAGSKYVGAHSLSALRKALDAGKRAICVVGLPCQVLSIRKMMLVDLKGEELRRRIKFVVGLFCNWAFSAREFTYFLTERLGGAAVSRIHIPPPPANSLEIDTDKETITISLEEVRDMIQASCGICSDMTSELADVSVGMYEGRPGWNTLVIRSDLGREVIAGMIQKRLLETELFPTANLAHLEFASRRKKQRATQTQS